MKRTVGAGILTFVLVGALAILFVYPFVFTTVLGLFDNNDLGTIIALGVCALITVPLIWLAIGLAAGGVFLTANLLDKRDAQRRRDNAERIRNSRRKI